MQGTPCLFERNGTLRAAEVRLCAYDVDQKRGLFVFVAVSRTGPLILFELVKPVSDIVKTGGVSNVITKDRSICATIIHRCLNDYY